MKYSLAAEIHCFSNTNSQVNYQGHDSVESHRNLSPNTLTRCHFLNKNSLISDLNKKNGLKRLQESARLNGRIINTTHSNLNSPDYINFLLILSFNGSEFSFQM